jgi:hypothetical protein
MWSLALQVVSIDQGCKRTKPVKGISEQTSRWNLSIYQYQYIKITYKFTHNLALTAKAANSSGILLLTSMRRKNKDLLEIVTYFVSLGMTFT